MKYIISSGKCVVSDIDVTADESLSVLITDNSNKAKFYDTFGDAVRVCTTVNNLIGKPAFKVMSIND